MEYALWESNKEEINSSSSAGKSDESITNVSATFHVKYVMADIALYRIEENIHSIIESASR